MTLEEAIKHQEELAARCEYDTDWGMGDYFIDKSEVASIIECGKRHRQLAELLKELKQLREQTRWVPVSERLPEKNVWVLVTVVQGSGYYVETMRIDKYKGMFTDNIDYYNSVIAWMPLPEPYKAESEVSE